MTRELYQRSNKSLILVPLFVALMLTLSSCSIFSDADDIQSTVSGGSRLSFDALRANDPQAKLGAKEHPKIVASYGGAYKNAQLESLLAPIAGALVTHSDSPDRAFSITVLNSPTVNAFALPGGYLYITRGLLALANDESEIAAVLAHEMAHVSSNHGIERRKRANATTIAERVVSDVVTNKAAGQIAKASSAQRLAAFSQAQELQADAVGIKLLGKSGFDPFAASRFLVSMERFTNWRSFLNSNVDDMNSSHPSTPRRIELARRHARSLGPQNPNAVKRARYMKQVDGILFGDSESEGFVRGQSFSHRLLNITFSVPPGFELTNRAQAVLAAGPNETALRFDAVSSRGQGAPASYLKSGWVNGLQPETVQATTIDGLDAATGRAEAGDWQFAVTVIAVKKRHFRFIVAAPKNSADVKPISQSMVGTFRFMTEAERQALKPLRLRVVKVQGRSIAQLARLMRGVSNKEQLFRALNGLDARDTRPINGTVKIVSD